MQGIDIVAQMPTEKQAALLLGNIHMAYLYTFFLGAPVVVFGLNLHKLQTTYAVGAEPYLLSVGMVPLVLVVHVHELYAAHLLECDRGKGAQYVVDCCHKRWQK